MANETNSTIRQSFVEAMKLTSEVLDLFPWENQQAYAAWLAQSHYFVSHSTRLLALAGAHAPLWEERLHKRMSAHIHEEIGHEKIALNDLRHLGFDISQFPQLPETKGFVMSQYYWIQHHSPRALMGYILFLEGLAIHKGPDVMKRLLPVYGTQATVFLKVHVEDDVEHVEQAFAQLEGISQKDEACILENMEMSAQLYFLILSKIQRGLKTSAPWNNRHYLEAAF